MKSVLPNFWCFNRSLDEKNIKSEVISWKGPFSWPSFEKENELNSVPDISGIYLLIFEYLEGYIIRTLGVSKSIKKRIYQHHRNYFKGQYTILDTEVAKKGIRKELWHGWEFAKLNQKLFQDNYEEIIKYTKRELKNYRIFIAEANDQRIRERVEATIVMNFYLSSNLYTGLIDGGMSLRNRFSNEMPIEVINICDKKIYGLPTIMEV